jgi:hypothetical protein
LNVFFDVDYTIIDSEGEVLRPHVHEVFERLVAEGHVVYLWSGMGRRWEVVRQWGLEHLVRDCFEKPVENHEQERVRLGVPFRPDYVVDDTPSVVTAFGGFVIRPFSPWKEPDDREMLRVYEAIQKHLAARL